jgi:hypothetical protein
LKRNLIQKSTYLHECIRKVTVKGWFEHLIQTPLYKRYNTEIDPTFLNVDNVSEDTYELGEIHQHPSDIECLLAQQHTHLWTEDKYLEISQVKTTNPLTLYTMSMPKNYRFRAYIWGMPKPLRPTWR